MTRRWLAIATLVQLACSGERLVSSRGELRATPNPLTFSEIAPGDTVSAPLQVTNETGARVELTLTTAAPYSVEPSSLTLEVGQQRTVDVRFSPASSGPQAGQLTLSSAASRTVVVLGGVARCASTAACSTARFDALLGCVDVPVANGTACSDPCLSGAQCRDGECRGAVLSCDDGDACTTDACGAGGCVHLSCPPPADPCQIASCEAGGCVTHDAADGSACGPRDCSTARVCLAGACVSAVPPEGAACDSSCGPGQCHAGQCKGGPLGLAVTWSYTTASATQLSSKLAQDAVGNLYWTENGFAATRNSELVSFTRNGALRFRTVQGPGGAISQQPLFVDDAAGVVVGARPGGALGAWRTSDGAALWSHAVIGDYFTATDVTPAVSTFLSSLADLGGGKGVAQFLLYPPQMGGVGSPSATALIGFEFATGKKLWGNLRTGLSSGVIADEHGNFYLLTYAAASKLESRDRAGALRWQAPMTATGWSAPSAVFDGKLYLGHGETLVTATGLLLAGPPISASEATQLFFTGLKDLEGAWLVSPNVAVFGEGQYARLRAVDPVTHQTKWTDSRGVYETSGGAIDASALLDDGSVLMIDLSTQWSLVHVDPAGRRGEACPLQLDRNRVWGPHGMVLDGERLFTSVQQQDSVCGVYAFDVPKVVLPRHGWPVAQGNINQGSAPR